MLCRSSVNNINTEQPALFALLTEQRNFNKNDIYVLWECIPNFICFHKPYQVLELTPGINPMAVPVSTFHKRTVLSSDPFTASPKDSTQRPWRNEGLRMLWKGLQGQTTNTFLSCPNYQIRQWCSQKWKLGQHSGWDMGIHWKGYWGLYTEPWVGAEPGWSLPTLQKDSKWSPHRVHLESKWSPWGVHVEVHFVTCDFFKVRNKMQHEE